MPTEHCRRWALTAIWLLPAMTGAEPALRPFAAAGVTYDSNVFGHVDRAEARRWSNSAAISDQLHHLDLGAYLDLALGAQRLRGTLQAQRHDYARFNQLDHYEHLAELAFDWQRGSALQGQLEVSRERRMPELADREGDRLAIERDRHGRASVDLAVTGYWHLDAAIASRRLEAPLQALPDFGLEDDSAALGLSYRGPDALAVGLVVEYLDGEFRGTGDHDRAFDQLRLEATLDYAVSGLSRLHARLGRTRRDEHADAAAATSALTGTLAITRTISGVSAMEFSVFRRVDSYLSGPDSIIETGASAGLNWQPSTRLNLQSRLEWTRSRFGAVDIGLSRRDDRYTRALLQLDYTARPWLSLHPFVELRNRDSNRRDSRYHRHSIGMDLRLHWGGDGRTRPAATAWR